MMPIGIYQHKSLSEETKNKIRQAMLGRKHSTETKEKISTSVKQWMQDNPEKFKEIYEKQKGKPKHSENFKKKISEIKKGKHQSAENEFKRGHSVPVNWIEKMRQKKIGVPSKKHGQNYEELYGYEKAQIIKQKLSKRHMGKKLSEAHIRAMSESHKRQFLDDAFRKKWAARFHRKPGPAEGKMIELINSSGLPFKYVGDYKLWIGNKNPDFIHTQGKNQVIELFGEYWHQTKPSIKQHQTAEGTVEHYKGAGFNCLII
jgi:hypothetical protein